MPEFFVPFVSSCSHLSPKPLGLLLNFHEMTLVNGISRLILPGVNVAGTRTFAVKLDCDLAALAQEWQISVTTAREVLRVQSLPTWGPMRWRDEGILAPTLRGRYHGVCADVQELSGRVVRASSLAWPLWTQHKGVVLLANFSGEPAEKVVVQFRSPMPVSKIRSLRNGDLKFTKDQRQVELIMPMGEVTDVLVLSPPGRRGERR